MLHRILAPLLSLALISCVTVAARPKPVAEHATRAAAPFTGLVNANDPRAQAAGEEMLRAGGSATDAALATMIALTVVEPQSSGIGGGGFLVRGTPDGAVESFDGRETAPVAAGPGWFLGPDGQLADQYLNIVLSGRSVGVPGNIALAARAHAKHGRLPWAKLFEPAIRLARDGFIANHRISESLGEHRARAGSTPLGRDLFYDADGNPPEPGERIVNPALAETLERIAAGGPDAFYQGEHAAALAATVREATPGAAGMATSDIESYEAKERAPVCGTYRLYRICGMGPPSSGGIAVLQILGQLEGFDLAAFGPDNPRAWHLFVESQKLAYADRELYTGDGDFVAIPVEGLVDPAYLAERGALLDPERANPSPQAGTPPGAPLARADGNEPVEHGTSHFVVIGPDGTMVSYTSTVEGAYGSGILFGGFFLNNELTDFSFLPERDGRPVANRVEGGKRPRSSMAPMVIYDPEGRPFLAIGAMGGATIPVQTARSIIGIIDFALPLEEALALPFMMHGRGALAVEAGSKAEAWLKELRAMGHEGARTIPFAFWTTGAIRTEDGWITARDPRLAPLVDQRP